MLGSQGKWILPCWAEAWMGYVLGAWPLELGTSSAELTVGLDMKTSRRDRDNAGGRSEPPLQDNPFLSEGLKLPVNSLATFPLTGGVYTSTL